MKENTIIHYDLNDDQEKKFNYWKHAIKILYGTYGYYTWLVSPTEIGTDIKVKSSLTKTTLELTDYSEW